MSFRQLLVPLFALVTIDGFYVEAPPYIGKQDALLKRLSYDYFSHPLESSMRSILATEQPDMRVFNELLSVVVPKLNHKLHTVLPQSVGNCSAEIPNKAPLPCRGNRSLYSIQKPWKYAAEVRWVTGLRTMNLTSAKASWNESSPGMSITLRGVFEELSASIRIAECFTLNHCMTLWDSSDACCGTKKHFEISVEAVCGANGTIRGVNFVGIELDDFIIQERIIGRRRNIANVTSQIRLAVQNYLTEQVPKLGNILTSFLREQALARKVMTALCVNAPVAGSACRTAIVAAPIQAKGFMFFSMGKQFFDQGSFNVCKEIPKHVGLTNFSTKHFTVSFTVEGTPGEVGLCLPAVCQNSDIANMLKYLHAREPLSAAIDMQIPSYSAAYPQPDGTVRHPNPVNDIDNVVKWSDPQGSPILTPIAIGFLLGLAALIGWSTYVMHCHANRERREYDRESATLEDANVPYSGFAQLKVVQAFSLIGPHGTWTALWRCPSSRPTDCLNGMKVISMLWIICGHSFGITAATAGYYNPEDVIKNVLNPDAAMTDPAWALLDLPGLDLSVDTFFFISGFLASYAGSTRETPFFRGASLRYLRLMPCLAFALMIYVLILPFLAVGPFAPRFQNLIFRRCHAWTWWTPLLFIMNFLPWYNDDVCMGWTWYLGNDMIFAVIGIALLNLWKWGPRSGWLATAFISVASFAITCVLIAHFNLQVYPNPQGPHANDYQYYLYDKPWSRIPAYLVGLVVPWLLNWADRAFGLRRGEQPRTKKAYLIAYCLVFIALCVIFGLLFVTVSDQYGPSGSSRTIGNWPVAANAIYLTFGRPLWACAHAIIALACFFDYVPLINGFLGHWLWTPLARLTFNAYLLHPLVINLRCGLAVQYYQCTAWTVFENVAVDAGLAYAAAIVAWCLVENPVASLTGSFFAKRQSVGNCVQPVRE